MFIPDPGVKRHRILDSDRQHSGRYWPDPGPTLR